MSVNSILSPESAKSAVTIHGYHDFVLMKESAVSKIYRVSKAGKYFIFKSAKDASGRMEALIKREYDLSINLNHPHIVNVFTFEDECEVGPGIVMEYVDGRNLSEFLSEGPSMKLRRRVLGQLLEAVAYLHCKGIIHNDLKPENILITRTDNTVKLLDLGLSDNDAWYLAKTMGCTQEYASPELLHQEKVDSRSDIYSLGLLMKDIKAAIPSYIIKKCLAYDRTKRYDNVEQIQKAIARRLYPLYSVLMTIFFIILSIIGLNFSGRIKEFKSFQAEEKEIQELCDSVYNVIDDTIHSMYSELEGRLSDIPYKEFGFLEMNKVMSKLPKFWNSFQEVTSDQALISGFITYCTLAQERYYSNLIDIIESKPSISQSELSDEEEQFYYLLISKEESYKPYQQ